MTVSFSWCEANAITIRVQSSSDSINPSKAQRLINRLRPGNAGLATGLLVKSNHQFFFCFVVFLQPFSEVIGSWKEPGFHSFHLREIATTSRTNYRCSTISTRLWAGSRLPPVSLGGRTTSLNPATGLTSFGLKNLAGRTIVPAMADGFNKSSLMVAVKQHHTAMVNKPRKPTRHILRGFLRIPCGSNRYLHILPVVTAM